MPRSASVSPLPRSPRRRPGRGRQRHPARHRGRGLRPPPPLRR